MRVIHQGVWTLALLAVAATPAAAQNRRDTRSLEESIERTIEAAAEFVENNVERWAELVERNAERWADDIEHNAERWAAELERNAERLAATIEAHVEASEQVTDRERELRERQRDLERQQREIQRELAEAQQERQREQQERQREQQREQQERQRERQQEQRERQREDLRNRQEFTEPFSRTVRLGRGGVVSVETIAGDIVVTGGGNDVRIDAVKRISHASESEARALLSQIRVEVTEQGGRVGIRAFFPPLRNGGGTVDYTLSVPNDADLILKTVSGDIRITNVNGDLRTESVSGDQHITGSAGSVVASVVSGDLVIRDVKSRGLRLNSVSGDITAANIEVDRADVGTVNGDIDYTGRLTRTGRYELHTHSGEVRVAPTGTTGFQVEATTFNGDIVSQYQLTTVPDNNVQRGFNPVKNRAVRGSFGDAGAALVLRSFNGDITIVRR